MSTKSLITSAAIGVLSFAAMSASAATVIIAPIPGGPFSDVNTIGSIGLQHVAQLATFDFTFQLVPPLTFGKDTVDIVATYLVGSSHVPTPVPFQIYMGTPTHVHPTAGVLVGTSTNMVVGGVLEDVFNQYLPAGTYYIHLNPLQKNERINGTLDVAARLLPVPEPSSWAMMLLGVGAIGGLMRRRVAKATAA